MTFQQRLTELLKDNQINYRTVAVKTDIPVTTLSNYINRGSSPSITQLSILADFFEVSVDYLIGRSDDFGNITVAANGAELQHDEQRLLTAYRSLNKIEQEKLIDDAEFYAKRYNSETKTRKA